MFTRILSCWLLLLALPVTGQQLETVFVPASKEISHDPYLRFDQFSFPDSTLSKSFTREMRLKDRQGYLWFLTESGKLRRYDGVYSKIFQEHIYRGIGQCNNGTIVALTEAGVAIFDSLTEKFTEYKARIAREDQLWPSMGIWDNMVYLSFKPPSPNPKGSFFQFDVTRRVFRKIPGTSLRNGFTDVIEGQDVCLARAFTVDACGRVWGQINFGNSSALGYYDLHAQQYVWYPLEGAYCPDFHSSKRADQSLDVYWVEPEANGRYIWVGGWWHTGMLRLDVQEKKWKQYYFNEIGFNRAYYATHLNPRQIIFTTEIGITIFDKETVTLHQYRHLPDNKFTPPDLEPQPFINDGKAFWIGLGNGHTNEYFSVLNPDRQYFRTVPYNPLYPFEKPLFKRGNELFFQYRSDHYMGVVAYDELHQTFRVIYREFNARTVGYEFLNTLPDSARKLIWVIGTTANGGLFRWREDRQVLENVKDPIEGFEYKTNEIAEIQDIARDQEGNVWLPTGNINNTVLSKAHLIKYNPGTDKFSIIKEGTHGLPANVKIKKIVCDSRGILWIGYKADNRIVWFDPRTEKGVVKDEIYRSQGTNASRTMNMVEDIHRKCMWIASYDKGLWRYDMGNDTWKQYRFNDAVLAVRLLKNGQIWLKTLNSLVRFDPETGKTRYLGQEYDLKNFLHGAFSMLPDEELFFGKYRFYAHEVKDDTLKPKAVFSFVNVFDKPLGINLNTGEALSLDYNQNFFSVGFSILSYVEREKNQYAYRLLEFNPDWVFAGNQSLAAFTNVPPGEYTLEVKGASYAGVWSDVRSVRIVIHPPFWQRLWFRVLTVLLMAGLLYTFYRYRLAQQTLKSRLKEEEALRKQREAEYQQRIVQTEITALRAQMNPHFIFNCLNSIQFYAANNDTEAAADYLTKFSRLIRLVLENSRSEKVTLSNELETLRLYIEMEAMRFGRKLSYEIVISEDISPDYYDIPPLLIQPFVENAVWHGLMHKPGGGHVTIAVDKLKTSPVSEVLRITVTDNGIGRARAGEIKSKSATQRKSFGMQVTAERIEHVNQLYDIETTVEIEDLVNAEDEPCGTKVIVQIPI